jgi:hypothetical protein
MVIGSQMENRKTLAKLLRSLADCIENSTGAEVDDLLAGTRQLRIESGGPAGLQPNKPKRPEPSERNWSGIVETLRTLPSRDDGQKLIEQLTLTRAELQQLARIMDLPISRQDTADRLSQKIIESSIGSRLVSQAIRGDTDIHILSGKAGGDLD